ncbi:MAG TPA: MBL fold metallo-hydrolase [Mycobacterium sp.]|jgi:glyoxylase-like metal-dependent hydrolase (beta-lactamase superfamily II)|nr:MBL fold metallo-hydrolase [Mycobacterium sp.]
MSLRAISVCVFFTAALAGCGGAADGHEQLRVERYASPNPGSVNAYWIDAPDGIIIVDAGRNTSGGQKIADMVAGKGQRVAAILLTHPHPDHVGGLGVLHARFPETPIYASEATDKWMRDDPLADYPLALQADPDYPQTLTYATETFAGNAELHIAGLTLQSVDLGPGESATATVYFEPSTRTLFGGDLTGYHVTPALTEGNSCGWLTNLAALSSRFGDADLIYPGHGDYGMAIHQINTQRDYLKRYRDLVRPAVTLDSDGGSIVTDLETQRIVDELDRTFLSYSPVASLPNLQELNIAAVGRELAAEDTATVPPECN